VSLSAEMRAIRRILVALDASPRSLSALHAAVELAAKMEAELSGLFVEDVDLLNLAEAPYAREILYATAGEVSLNRAGMERKFKAQAEQARKALAAAAERAQVPWSFRTVRGKVAPEVVAAAGGADLIMLGRQGWSFSLRPRVGSTALAVMAEAIPALILCERGLMSSLPVLVCYDGSRISKRALDTAAHLAESGSKTLILVLLAKGSEVAHKLRETAAESLRARRLKVEYRIANPEDEANLMRILKSERVGMLVLPTGTPFSRREPIEDLLRDLETSLMFLGTEPASELEQNSSEPATG
jgi:nucleotide-binding universal stress UspA family protein